MNKSLIALSALAFVSAGAFAQDADPAGQFATQVTSQRTRAEVQSEDLAGVARGAFRPSNPHASEHVQPELANGTTRAQVVAEFLADRDQANAMTSEDSGSTYLAKAGHVRGANEYIATAR
jgi:hypothetical protein